MRMEAPDLKQEKERIAREDLESGISGGISEEKADQLYKVTETTEAREENVARLREEVMKAVETAQIASDVPVEVKAMPQQKSEEMPAEKSFKNKVLSFFGQAPEQLSNKYKKLGEERMRGNRALFDKYNEFKQTEGNEVAESYKEAIGKWRYVARDGSGNFIDKTVYSVASGENPEAM